MEIKAILNQPQIEPLLKELKNKALSIIGEDHLLSVIIYGSYASNATHEESDLDIMILTDLNESLIKQKEEAIWHFSAELLMKYHIFPSVLVLNESTFYERASHIPFYKAVLKEGIPFYERP